MQKSRSLYSVLGNALQEKEDFAEAIIDRKNALSTGAEKGTSTGRQLDCFGINAVEETEGIREQTSLYVAC